MIDVPVVTEAPWGPPASLGIALGVRQLRVMLRPVPGRREACAIVVSTGLNRSHGRNALAARVFSGTWAPWARAAPWWRFPRQPVSRCPVSLGVYGACYRHSLRERTEVLGRMLQAVDAHARTVVFTPAMRPWRPAARRR